jgi:hypothetical protein
MRKPNQSALTLILNNLKSNFNLILSLSNLDDDFYFMSDLWIKVRFVDANVGTHLKQLANQPSLRYLKNGQ